MLFRSNQNEVHELFSKRLDFKLQLGDFVRVEANWGEKSRSVETVLKSLHILPEHTIFVDDNPWELLEVKKKYPEITLIDARDKITLNNCLEYILAFNQDSNQDQSITRQRDLAAQEKRESFFTSQNMENWSGTTLHEELQTKIVIIKQPKDIQIDRANELFAKTNQFNATIARSVIIGEEYKRSKKELVLGSVSDRFSNSGIVSALLVSDESEDGLEILEFVISCRALGRNLELFLFTYSIPESSRKRERIFVKPTIGARNRPFQDFLEKYFLNKDQLWILDWDCIEAEL